MMSASRDMELGSLHSSQADVRPGPSSPTSGADGDENKQGGYLQTFLNWLQSKRICGVVTEAFAAVRLGTYRQTQSAPAQAKPVNQADPSLFLPSIEKFRLTGCNYLQPDKYKQLSKDFSTMLVVAGLLVAGNYQVLYVEFTPVSSTPGTCNLFTTFASLNYAGVVLALVAALLAIMGTVSVARHQPWPTEWDSLPPVPDAITKQKGDAASSVAMVEKYARGLNFIRHVAKYHLMPAWWQIALRWIVFFGWLFLVLAICVTFAAATVALRHHTRACHDTFFGLSITAEVLVASALLVFLVWGCIYGCSKAISVVAEGCTAAAGKADVPAGGEADAVGAGGRTAQGAGTFWQRLNRALIRFLAGTVHSTLKQDVADAKQALLEDEMTGKLKSEVAAGKITKARIWKLAINLARQSAAAKSTPFPWTSQAALDLQSRMAEEFSAITPILDVLDEWKKRYGDYYAVNVFLDEKLVLKALNYRAELEKFWGKLDRQVESGEVTLDEFFTSGSYGPVWEGRAKIYRAWAEQLEIVNWYYYDKHIDQANPHLPKHYAHNLLKGDEYHVDTSLHQNQPRINEDYRKPRDGLEYGGYEEWLVKGSYCRSDRFRLIQEWEARKPWRNKDGSYKAVNWSEPLVDKPKSSMELAYLLQDNLKESISFKKLKDWPPEFKLMLKLPEQLPLIQQMEEEYAPVATVMEKLLAWSNKHGPYWAVQIFKDPERVVEALEHRIVVEGFWTKLCSQIKKGFVALDDVFNENRQHRRWQGRAALHRRLGEPLDIVNWYYKDKHIHNVDTPKHYLTPGFIDEAAAGATFEEAVQEYTSSPEAFSNADRPQEEWLVRGSNCRPDRYRLLQEAETRALLRNQDGSYPEPGNCNDKGRKKPDSSLELAWLLTQYLQEDEPFAGMDVDDFKDFATKEKAAGLRALFKSEAQLSATKQLQAWATTSGKHYAIFVFKKDQITLNTALATRERLQVIWDKLDSAIKNGLVTLDDVFPDAASMDQARKYRQLGEQLDIVHWYYKNRHKSDSGAHCPGAHYFTADFYSKDAAAGGSRVTFSNAVQEYHLQKAAITTTPTAEQSRKPVVPADRQRRRSFLEAGKQLTKRYGGYEEWLVKGSYRRRNRFRLIQEAEARVFVRAQPLQEDGSYGLDVVSKLQSEVDSSLKLAWLLREYLGHGKDFSDLQLPDLLTFAEQRGVNLKERWPDELEGADGLTAGPSL